MKFELNEVYTIKIANGDEIVAKVLDQGPDTITVAGPLTVLPSAQGIQLMPSLFTSEPDDSVTINISNIAMYASARQQVKDSYTEARTGITPVRKSILTG
jgi:hypothetical protein